MPRLLASSACLRACGVLCILDMLAVLSREISIVHRRAVLQIATGHELL
jgi:hypothetical protein